MVGGILLLPSTYREIASSHTDLQAVAMFLVAMLASSHHGPYLLFTWPFVLLSFNAAQVGTLLLDILLQCLHWGAFFAVVWVVARLVFRRAIETHRLARCFGFAALPLALSPYVGWRLFGLVAPMLAGPGLVSLGLAATRCAIGAVHCAAIYVAVRAAVGGSRPRTAVIAVVGAIAGTYAHALISEAAKDWLSIRVPFWLDGLL